MSFYLSHQDDMDEITGDNSPQIELSIYLKSIIKGGDTDTTTK